MTRWDRVSLNPIQFGKDVIDQFGRYLLTTFRLSDPHLAAQLKAGLAYAHTHERLAKGPYVFLNRPFVRGLGISQLIAEEGLDLHPALKGLFPFETLHKHQDKSLRAALAGRHVLLATGTGSVKTEGFLLPILDYCLKLRDSDWPSLREAGGRRSCSFGSRATYSRRTSRPWDRIAGRQLVA